MNYNPSHTFLPKNTEGYFLSECSPDLIQSPWKEAVEETKQYYQKFLGDNLHSIYLRGSIPKGRAIEFVSDLDVIAIVHQKKDTDWITPCNQELKKKFPFVQYFDFHFILLDQFFESRFLLYHFTIKHLSICIEGEDLSKKISPFKPSKILGYAFCWDILNEIHFTSQKIAQSQNETEIRKLTVWITKRLIRAGFCLCIDLEKEFTRDLELCTQVFQKYFPHQSLKMQQALEWSLSPTSNKNQILDYLKKIDDWFQPLFTQKFHFFM